MAAERRWGEAAVSNVGAQKIKKLFASQKLGHHATPDTFSAFSSPRSLRHIDCESRPALTGIIYNEYNGI